MRHLNKVQPSFCSMILNKLFSVAYELKFYRDFLLEKYLFKVNNKCTAVIVVGIFLASSLLT